MSITDTSPIEERIREVIFRDVKIPMKEAPTAFVPGEIINVESNHLSITKLVSDLMRKYQDERIKDRAFIDDLKVTIHTLQAMGGK